MFVTKSKYDSLVRKYSDLVDLHADAVSTANKLVERINEKGGKEFLDHGIVFSEEDLDKLIRLCHPDKHQGSKNSESATKLLLKMREEIKS